MLLVVELWQVLSHAGARIPRGGVGYRGERRARKERMGTQIFAAKIRWEGIGVDFRQALAFDSSSYESHTNGQGGASEGKGGVGAMRDMRKIDGA